jgi:hypothetical protein
MYRGGEERHYDRRFFAPYRTLIKDVPVFPVLGNHDVRKENGAAFLENVHPPLGSTKRYYSFYGGERVDGGRLFLEAVETDGTVLDRFGSITGGV